MDIDPTQYRQTFLDEADELLVALEAALLQLGGRPDDAVLVNDAFRAAHSVKGGADAVGFVAIAQFTHVLEGLLDHLRTTGRVSRSTLDLLLEATDGLGRLVTAAKTGAAEVEGIDALLARLNAQTAPGPKPAWWKTPEATLGLLESPVSPTSAPPPPPTTETPFPSVDRYIVKIVPHADALRAGLDPLRLLAEVARLGTVHHILLHDDLLPPLADLDPERCYLAWTLKLETDRTETEILDVFAFASDHVRVTVEAAPPIVPPSMSQIRQVERKQLAPDAILFAAFLAEHRVITAEQALAALSRDRAARPSLGRLAVQSGRMTTEQLFDTLDAMQAGQGFGQIALQRKYLKEDDLGWLFLVQEQNSQPFGDGLVAEGLLTPAALAAEIAAFRADAKTPPQHAASEMAVPELADLGATILQENGPMIADFCTEAEEHLEAAVRHLFQLDANPTNDEALNAIYRGFHTIKGVSSMLGLETIRTVAHEAENLLNMAREGKVVLQGKTLDLALASTDALSEQIKRIKNWSPGQNRIQPDPRLGHLLADLKAVVAGKALAERGAEPKPEMAPNPAMADLDAPARIAAPALHPEVGEPTNPTAPAGKASDKETVRVDKDRLDKLINTIGELVIAQSMAQQEFDELNVGSGQMSLALPELSKISRDLQELSLSLRMVPLQGTFQKMKRLVRDLARKMDKPVDLEVHGEETELDKTVVDQLGDPLMHMVRNAIDHGLESPAERVEVGKPVEGKVILRAYHQGGSVLIELADDGKGLDRDRILKKAIEKGIISESQRLSDSEIYALIFEPGFSTAKAVTDVSGRGVGMDVVRRNVEALQGNILIRTKQGQGTLFTIRLPLTLAIMDGLIVGVGDDVYVLPLLSVIESFRPRPSDLHRVAARGEAVTVRGEVVPLLRLHQILGRPCRVTDPCRGLVVLVEDQGKKQALLVDELLGQMQAVVKSLDANYRRVEGLAGATILGDGRVAMILDIHGLNQLHNQFGGRMPVPTNHGSEELVASHGELL